MKNKQMYSYHIFLFPFRWKNVACLNGDKTALKDCFSLKEFENALKVDSQWEINKFKLDNPANYNEYNYFYDFVREILYDLDEALQTTSNKINVELIKHFEYKPANISSNQNEPLYFHVRLKNGEHYALEIDSILLNIYATGTGILSFHLRNRLYDKPDDILKINQYGRRICPPFFGLDDSSIITGQKDNTKKDKQLADSKNELADAIWISKENIKINTNGYNFSEYVDKEEFYKHGPFLLPRFIKELFPKNFFVTHEKDLDLDPEPHSKIYLRAALDDRMYVVSWYGNNQLVDYLKREINDYESVHYEYEKNDWWYKYVFTDAGSLTVQNRLMKQELLKKHTYSRWTDYGTFYGITRYSLVLLTSDFDTLSKADIDAAFLVRHIQTLYYKMAELVLLQRATILSFSDEVTHLSDLVHQSDESKKNKEDIKVVSGKIRDLHKHYILFVNKIYFREITAQEQGIEMYDLLQKAMRIERDVKDLDSEIQELNQFVTMELNHEEQMELKNHTIIATIFLPAFLLASFIGMSTMPDKWKISLSLPIYWPFWVSFAGIVFLIGLFLWRGESIINKIISTYYKLNKK